MTAPRALAIAVLAVSALAARAHADDRDEARREFAAGQDADKRKDFQGAIVHYLRANDLFPHHFAIYNIAHDYEQLNQLREAAVWYERYLAASPDVTERGKVKRTMLELRARPSKLAVTSQPAGARVTIDRAVVGTTPYAGVVRGGEHHVVVERDGQREERDITLEFGEPGELAITVGAAIGANGTLVVTGPAGAVVTVDGMAVGIVPTQVTVAAGQHTVHVQASGFEPFDARPIVPAGDVARVDAPSIKAQDSGAPGGSRRLVLNYLLGVTAGADAKTAEGVLLAGFGARIARLDFLAHVGRYGSATEFDVVFRWHFLTSRLTPFIAGGYSGISSGGGGWQITGGARFDLSRGEKVTLSLLLEGGVRYFSSTDSVTGMSTSGITVPILGSLEIAYGGIGQPR
jgi:hypothetical protein